MARERYKPNTVTSHLVEPVSAVHRIRVPFSTQLGNTTARDSFTIAWRYYHPLLQRFLSEDPHVTVKKSSCLASQVIPPVRGTPVGLTDPANSNLYSYVTNNPMNLIDPDGLIPKPPERPEPPRRPSECPCRSQLMGCTFIGGYAGGTDGDELC